jgi:hypothetical protein
MAAGTDITHPVSPIDVVYKPLPIEAKIPLCTIKESPPSSSFLDNSNFTQMLANMSFDREAAAGRPPRPTPVSDVPRPLTIHRRSASVTELTTLNSLPSSSDLV